MYSISSQKTTTIDNVIQVVTMKATRYYIYGIVITALISIAKKL